MSNQAYNDILELWKENRVTYEKMTRKKLHYKWLSDSNFCKLYRSLDNEQRECLEKYICAARDKYLKGIDEAFVIGFKKGMRLAIEGLMSEDNKKLSFKLSFLVFINTSQLPLLCACARFCSGASGHFPRLQGKPWLRRRIADKFR